MSAQHFLVPIQLEFWMQSALEQDLVASECDGLLDFFQQYFPRQHVTFFVFGAAVERAEVTDCGANVGVIDIAINVVGSIVLRVQPIGHCVGGSSERRQVIALEQFQSFGRIQSLTRDGFVEYLFDHETDTA